MIPRMMTVPEVQEVLRLRSETGVMKLINSGELPAIKPNLMWLVREDDLDAFLRGESPVRAKATGGAA